MTSGLALYDHWSVGQKLNRASSVQFSYVALYSHLRPNFITPTLTKILLGEGGVR